MGGGFHKDPAARYFNSQSAASRTCCRALGFARVALGDLLLRDRDAERGSAFAHDDGSCRVACERGRNLPTTPDHQAGGTHATLAGGNRGQGHHDPVRRHTSRYVLLHRHCGEAPASQL